MGAETEVCVGELGRAPHTVLPTSLSPSRAEEFRQCELKAFFAGVERWRTPPTEHTALGNVVHDVAEQLYKLPADARTREAAEDLLEQLWPTWQAKRDHALLLSANSGTTIKSRARTALNGLFELEEPSEIAVTPDQLEAWVEAPLYGAPVRGRIDRMTDTGIWTISDYKTGRQPAATYLEKKLAGLFTYAAALAASHPERRLPDQVELLFLLGPVRIRRPVLRPYLLQQAKALGATWDAFGHAHSSGTWLAKTGPLCDWCAFKPACPAKTRTAPTPGTADSHTTLAELQLSRPSDGHAPAAVSLGDTGADPDLDAAEVAVSEAEPEHGAAHANSDTQLLGMSSTMSGGSQ